jgi:hypothetical protein
MTLLALAAGCLSEANFAKSYLKMQTGGPK